MDEFTKACLECALWSSCDWDSQVPLDEDYDIEDFNADTLAELVQDCKDFQEHYAETWRAIGMSDSQAGHDFWLTRNGHGTGFWDRGLGEVGEQLSEACKPYGSVDLYACDGEVYS